VTRLAPTRAWILPAVSPENEDAVRLFAEAVNRGDAEAAVAVSDPEIEFLSVLAVSGRAYHGHDGVRQYFDDVASAWAEWRVELHRIAPAPDGRVAIVMTMHFRGKESGAALSDSTAHVWTLRHGKLLRNHPYRNPEQALREVDVAP
jgi:ketosteroid isomerase-like protein